MLVGGEGIRTQYSSTSRMYTSTSEYTTHILEPGIIAHYTYPAMQKEQKRRKINTRHELIHDTEQASHSYVALMSPIGDAPFLILLASFLS